MRRRLRPRAPATRRQLLELGLRFDVEAQDVLARARKPSRACVLPTPENMIRLRRHARRAGAPQFALRRRRPCRRRAARACEHGLIGIGLHGVADERRHIGKNAREGEILLLETGARVKIDGRADLRGDIAQVDLLGVQHAVAVAKGTHGSSRLSGSWDGSTALYRRMGKSSTQSAGSASAKVRKSRLRRVASKEDGPKRLNASNREPRPGIRCGLAGWRGRRAHPSPHHRGQNRRSRCSPRCAADWLISEWR